MAFDGIITRAMANELAELLVMGKIDRIYQPAKDEIVLHVHTKNGNLKLYASSSSLGPRVNITERNLPNPPVPYSFCMLLRKHLSGGRITSVKQKDAERIIEISLETIGEMGFTESKKLIFEIMGKHSNIILVNTDTGNIIDSIKRVSIDTSRVRQVLPGMRYDYPPAQDKTAFDRFFRAGEAGDPSAPSTAEDPASLPDDPSSVLAKVGGISPAVAREIAGRSPEDRAEFFNDIKKALDEPHGAILYLDEQGTPVEYHVLPLSEYEASCERREFPTLSECVDAFFQGRSATNLIRQRSNDLTRTVSALIDKARLKEQRLLEDIKVAEDSEHLRLYGELITANIHAIPHGASSVELINYYTGEPVAVPLDPRFTPSKNAQICFKKYGKARTAVKEKQIQLEETKNDAAYLESVLTYLENMDRPEDIEQIRSELVETGYIKKRKAKGAPRRFKLSPLSYRSPSGYEILVGRNNKENDELTLKLADKQDTWLHTKDIPGSHVIVRNGGKELTAEDIYCAASIAAWHSKARSSGQVPVDYVRVRNIKKPAGAKPGMVIFTGNRTVYVDPRLPDQNVSPE